MVPARTEAAAVRGGHDDLGAASDAEAVDDRVQVADAGRLVEARHDQAGERGIRDTAMRLRAPAAQPQSERVAATPAVSGPHGVEHPLRQRATAARGMVRPRLDATPIVRGDAAPDAAQVAPFVVS